MYAENGKTHNRKNVICRCAFLIPILMDLCFFIQVMVIRSGAFPKLPTWLKLILEMRGIKRYYSFITKVPADCTCSQTMSQALV